MKSSPVEFGGSGAGVVGGRTEAEHDDAEIVEEVPPHEAEEKTPQQRDGEPMIESLRVAGGDPASRGD